MRAADRRAEEPVVRVAFLRRMRRRLEVRRKVLDGALRVEDARGVRTLWDFDDRITARAFGFSGADHYYGTQSCGRFLDGIRVPSLVIQAKDDPLIPFGAFDHPAFATNPFLKLEAVEHGGHIGFLSKALPRMWVDTVVRNWIVGAGHELTVST